MSTPRRRYTQELKDQLVEVVIELSQPIAEDVREYGTATQSLGNSVKKFRQTHGQDDAGSSTKTGVTAREQALGSASQGLKAELSFVKSSSRLEPSVQHS